MATLIFAQAKSIRRKALQVKQDTKASHKAGGQSKEYIEEQAEIMYNKKVASEVEEFRQILEVAKQLHEVYVETTGCETRNWYWVTLRPDEKKIDFEKFKGLVFKKLNSAQVLEYKLSFEQKGKSVATLGTGFHAHFVVHCTWRSKAGVIRAMMDLFKNYMAENCIQVSPTKNPSQLVSKYLVEYESENGHKKETQVWDKIWRAEKGLEDLYVKGGDDPVIKSVTGSS